MRLRLARRIICSHIRPVETQSECLGHLFLLSKTNFFLYASIFLFTSSTYNKSKSQREIKCKTFLLLIILLLTSKEEGEET